MNKQFFLTFHLLELYTAIGYFCYIFSGKCLTSFDFFCLSEKRRVYRFVCQGGAANSHQPKKRKKEKKKKGFTFKNFLPLKFMSLKPERFNKQKFGFKNALC